uniref:Ribosome assembly factor mrt4 n=1 Tax=Oryza nivara TaxID=4536 RepID=A0A0E0J5S6_ORYNI
MENGEQGSLGLTCGGEEWGCGSTAASTTGGLCRRLAHSQGSLDGGGDIGIGIGGEGSDGGGIEGGGGGSGERERAGRANIEDDVLLNPRATTPQSNIAAATASRNSTDDEDELRIRGDAEIQAQPPCSKLVISTKALICAPDSSAVTLSKTKKKPGLEHKGKVVTDIKDAVEHYANAYVFTYDNMRNQKLKDLREQLKSSSRIFLAGKKVMQIALGRSPADEAKTGLHKLSKFLQGDTGLFFTNLPRDDVERLFREFEEHDFARTGSIATETVELKEGPLEQFTHEMEPFLRKQGMPVRLNKGAVELVADHIVCEEGKPISPEAAQTLRLLGMQMATFRLYLVCRWSSDDFEVYKEGLAQLRAEADDSS